MARKIYPSNSSILNRSSMIKAVSADEVDGVDYINIAKHSKSELGKMLSIGYPTRIKTIFGKVGTVRSFMDFIRTPGYPINLLGKERLSPKDIASIPKRSVSIPNYWAIVAYVVCERVKQDKELKKLLLNNNIQFTSYDTIEKRKFFNTTVEVSIPNIKMGRYIAIIREVSEMLKANKFSNTDIENFIEECKDHRDLDLFEGTPMTVSTATPVAKDEAVVDTEPTTETVDEVNTTTVTETNDVTDEEPVDTVEESPVETNE